MWTNEQRRSLICRVTDNSLIVVAVIGILINIITFFALKESQYQWPRYVPMILGGVAIAGAYARSAIPLQMKLWGFIALQFTVGCYNLLLGLIDMASLWFVLALTYAVFASERREALYLFIISLIAVLVTGVLMMTKATFIPLQYNFEACQFSCVAVRIVHFLLIGTLTYYVVHTMYREVSVQYETVSRQSSVLSEAYQALEKETEAKRAAQQRGLEMVILTEEKERKRIAAEVHDGLGPVMSSINHFFQAYVDADGEESRTMIEGRLKSAIKTAMSDISRLAHHISPLVLEEFGLIRALDIFISRLSVNQEVKISAKSENIDRFDLKRELALYRCITELISNSLKHARASQISIRCSMLNRNVTILYQDDGCGFLIDGVEKSLCGMGIANIRNRIRSLGGTLNMTSVLQRGMSAQIDLPTEDELAA